MTAAEIAAKFGYVLSRQEMSDLELYILQHSTGKAGAMATLQELRDKDRAAYIHALPSILRDINTVVEGTTPFAGVSIGYHAREAADEIEHLRVALKTVRGYIENCDHQPALDEIDAVLSR